jgi:hypothetical protein
MRTSSGAVKGILLRDYDGKADLTPFIATASAMVDQVVYYAQRKVIPFFHSATLLELIERWLAAHYYACSDQPFSQKSTEGASGGFQGKTADFIQGTKYGQTALRLDVSGVLEALDRRKVAGGFWAGTKHGESNESTETVEDE